MPKGRISVILSSYNRPDLLRKSLLSLNMQTVLPYEVIITDDGSKVDIPVKLNNLISILNFKLKYIWQPDKGFRLSKSRNNAIREVAGDYVIFMDQDIIHTRGYIETYKKNMRANEFLTAFLVLLSKEQSDKVSEESIINGEYLNIITKRQLETISKQYLKDTFYYYQRKLILKNDYRPKVRGGYFGLHKKHIIEINGFDENYVGWGWEDDDFGRRLYKNNVIGRTVFKNEFPIHLYHPENHDNTGNSVNTEYFNKRVREINNGDIRAVVGLEESNPDKEMKIIELN